MDEIETKKSGVRVFLSYSRKDSEFLMSISDTLAGIGYIVDYDKSSYDPDKVSTGIAPTDEWWLRLQDMIAAADVMVLVVSPDSASSNVVDEEIAYARSLSKRIVAISCREVDFDTVPRRLGALNVMDWFIKLDFDEAILRLSNALNRDVDWLRAAADLTVAAKSGSDADRNEDYLLVGSEISDAEGWSARRPQSEKEVSELVLDFISNSRNAEQEKGLLCRPIK